MTFQTDLKALEWEWSSIDPIIEVGDAIAMRDNGEDITVKNLRMYLNSHVRGR